MTDFAVAIWAVGIAAWVVFVAYVIWVSRQVWKDRLVVRCPESGAITLIGVECVSLRAGSPPQLAVKHCGLWPAKAGCNWGCLARYEQTVPGFLPNLSALRPFDHA